MREEDIMASLVTTRQSITQHVYILPPVFNNVEERPNQPNNGTRYLVDENPDLNEWHGTSTNHSRRKIQHT